MKQLHDFYSNRIDVLHAEINRRKHRNHAFITIEILAFVSFVAFIVLYTLVEWGILPILLSLIALSLYVITRQIDVKNSDAIERLENLSTVYHNEISYLEGDFSCFDDGDKYKDSSHPFTLDLDIFGKDSLYNRINRTITTGGSSRLASYLSSVGTTDKSDAIDVLAEEESWRNEFLAIGQPSKIDTDLILNLVDKVRDMSMPSFSSSMLAFIVAWLSILGFWTTVVLSVFSVVSANVPIWWAIINFFIVFASTSKPLRNISKDGDSLYKQMRPYNTLVSHCCNMTVVPKAYTERVNSLHTAMQSFSCLTSVLNGIDRRSNVLGLFIVDALFLSDFFLVRKFDKWKRNYLGHTAQWIDIMNDIDALVSMATMRFNHPETVHAEIVDSDDITYEALGLYHPFIGAKAVSNDFTIKDHNYYIITGANMAGKSTFLRSIGVNYVLAMNGLPVFARSLRVSRFNLFSSMRTADDLSHGISYFNAELIRLQQLKDSCAKARRTLIILDEILKGTNSLDKLNGSRMFLEYISKMPVSGIIATHDLELSKMSDEHPSLFHNYCFEIGLGSDVTYSYKITPGVARNQNATYLLRKMLVD